MENILAAAPPIQNLDSEDAGKIKLLRLASTSHSLSSDVLNHCDAILKSNPKNWRRSDPAVSIKDFKLCIAKMNMFLSHLDEFK